jgi:hypothetical protein
MSAPPSERALRHGAQQLVDLLKVPGFHFLQGEVEKKAERMMAELSARLMGGEEMVTLQRDVDRARGFIAGMRYVAVEVPKGATRTLERLEQEPETESEPKDGWSYGDGQDTIIG